MKSLVVYDSFFGNTEQAALEIKRTLQTAGEVRAFRAADTDPVELKGVELLVVGSPTRAFRPTSAVMALLGRIPSNGLAGVSVAAFDTRIPGQAIKSRLLRGMVTRLGYAAPAIAKVLVSKGGRLVVEPEGFSVDDSKGPLSQGELERAGEWAGRIISGIDLS